MTVFGANNGILDLDIFDGTPPYTVELTGTTITLPLNNLGPGTYPVVITDSSGDTFNISCEIIEPPCVPPGGLTLINLTYRWWDNVNQTGTATFLGSLSYAQSCESYYTYSEDVTVSILTGETYVNSFTVGGTLYSSLSVCNCDAIPATAFWVNLVNTSASVNQTDGVYYVAVDKPTCTITQLSACTEAPPQPPACNDCGIQGISFSDGIVACPTIVGFSLSTLPGRVTFTNTSTEIYRIYDINGTLLGTSSPNQPLGLTTNLFVNNVIVVEPTGYPVGACQQCYSSTTLLPITCP